MRERVGKEVIWKLEICWEVWIYLLLFGYCSPSSSIAIFFFLAVQFIP
jgi:hypothetical protein